MEKDGIDGPRGGEGAVADALERISGKLVTGVVIGSAVIGLAIYTRPGPPRYEVVASPTGEILRIDNRKGSIISCAPDNKCYLVLKRGQNLSSRQDRKALPAPAAQPAAPQPAVSPPAPAPAKP